jgi:hypothetical protein
MLATPVLLWPEQSLPAAFRSCTGLPYEPTTNQLAPESSWRRPDRIAPGAFSDQAEVNLRAIPFK